MKTELLMVKEFQIKFKNYTQDKPILKVPTKVKALRKRLQREELKEVWTAIKNKDLVNLAKEYADLLYVVYGGILEHGLTDIMPEVFRIVHESNMSKLDKDGNPIFREDGKVLKSELYKPADLSILFPSEGIKDG